MGEIMLPVVNVLQHLLKVNSIQLCPIAAFTSIPLHAGAMSGGSLYLLIHTHTLSALIGSRQMMKRRVDTVRLSCQSDKVNRGSWLLTALFKGLVRKLYPEIADNTMQQYSLEALQENRRTLPVTASRNLHSLTRHDN